MSYDEIEIPAYLKKKKSNVSKSSVKTKHKHLYEKCLLVESGSGHVTRAKFCTVCGKVHDIKMFTVERVQGGYRALTQEEILAEYKDAPKFTVEDVLIKSVPIEQE